MFEIKDDRTLEQAETHTWLVVGTDSFLSGWGRAESRTSLAAWACEYEDLKHVTEWVESRSDMKRVRVVLDSPYRRRYRPRGDGLLHIYVVDDNHPSVERARAFKAEMKQVDKNAKRRRKAQAVRMAKGGAS